MMRCLCIVVIGLCYSSVVFGQHTEESQFNGFVTRSDNESVFLSWEIPDSSSIEYFIVEKSKNGLQWQGLDTVWHDDASYTYADKSPLIGLNYYRIFASGSGRIFYSIIRRAYVGRIDNTVTVYPNPVSKNLRFQMTALAKGRYNAAVYNSTGSLIAGRIIEHDGNNNAVTIALPPVINRGIYRLVLLTKTEFYKQIFLVQ